MRCRASIQPGSRRSTKPAVSSSRRPAVLSPAFGPGRPLPSERVGYLRERGSGGRVVRGMAATSRGRRLERPGHVDRTAGDGLCPPAWARGMVGVVGIGSHDPLTAASLVEHVPALATFASILGAQLAPRLEGRRRDAEGRAKVQAVLDAAAFRPFFQPIVELASGVVVGHEALTRFDDRVPPDARFAEANRAGLGPSSSRRRWGGHRCRRRLPARLLVPEPQRIAGAHPVGLVTIAARRRRARARARDHRTRGDRRLRPAGLSWRRLAQGFASRSTMPVPATPASATSSSLRRPS